MCPGGLGSFGYGAYRSQRSSQDGLRGRALGFDSLGAPAAAACRGFRGALALGGLPKKGSCVAGPKNVHNSPTRSGAFRARCWRAAGWRGFWAVATPLARRRRNRSARVPSSLVELQLPQRSQRLLSLSVPPLENGRM